MSTLPSVGVFWDFENCRLPGTSSSYDVARRIRELALQYGACRSFKAYFDFDLRLSLRVRSELQSSGVSLVDCPHAGRKEVADHMMITDITFWAAEHPAPATVILMTGDCDFSYPLSILQQRGYKTILVASSNTSSRLRSLISTVVEWSELTGSPTKASSAQSDTGSRSPASTASTRITAGSAKHSPVSETEKTGFLATVASPKLRIETVVSSQAGSEHQASASESPKTAALCSPSSSSSPHRNGHRGVPGMWVVEEEKTSSASSPSEVHSPQSPKVTEALLLMESTLQNGEHVPTDVASHEETSSFPEASSSRGEAPPSPEISPPEPSSGHVRPNSVKHSPSSSSISSASSSTQPASQLFSGPSNAEGDVEVEAAAAMQSAVEKKSSPVDSLPRVKAAVAVGSGLSESSVPAEVKVADDSPDVVTPTVKASPTIPTPAMAILTSMDPSDTLSHTNSEQSGTVVANTEAVAVKEVTPTPPVDASAPLVHLETRGETVGIEPMVERRPPLAPVGPSFLRSFSKAWFGFGRARSMSPSPAPTVLSRESSFAEVTPTSALPRPSSSSELRTAVEEVKGSDKTSSSLKMEPTESGQGKSTDVTSAEPSTAPAPTQAVALDSVEKESTQGPPTSADEPAPAMVEKVASGAPSARLPAPTDAAALPAPSSSARMVKWVPSKTAEPLTRSKSVSNSSSSPVTVPPTMSRSVSTTTVAKAASSSTATTDRFSVLRRVLQGATVDGKANTVLRGELHPLLIKLDKDVLRGTTFRQHLSSAEAASVIQMGGLGNKMWVSLKV